VGKVGSIDKGKQEVHEREDIIKLIIITMKLSQSTQNRAMAICIFLEEDNKLMAFPFKAQSWGTAFCGLAWNENTKNSSKKLLYTLKWE